MDTSLVTPGPEASALPSQVLYARLCGPGARLWPQAVAASGAPQPGDWALHVPEGWEPGLEALDLRRWAVPKTGGEGSWAQPRVRLQVNVEREDLSNAMHPGAGHFHSALVMRGGLPVVCEVMPFPVLRADAASQARIAQIRTRAELRDWLDALLEEETAAAREIGGPDAPEPVFSEGELAWFTEQRVEELADKEGLTELQLHASPWGPLHFKMRREQPQDFAGMLGALFIPPDQPASRPNAQSVRQLKLANLLHDSRAQVDKASPGERPDSGPR